MKPSEIDILYDALISSIFVKKEPEPEPEPGTEKYRRKIIKQLLSDPKIQVESQFWTKDNDEYSSHYNVKIYDKNKHYRYNIDYPFNPNENIQIYRFQYPDSSKYHYAQSVNINDWDIYFNGNKVETFVNTELTFYAIVKRLISLDEENNLNVEKYL